MAVLLAINCVRDTFLEDLHGGTFPSSKTGDYTDVKVVTPYGEIPWADVSRISQEEMKAFMTEVVDRLYTGVRYPVSLTRSSLPPWRRPRLHRDMMDWRRYLRSLLS